MRRPLAIAGLLVGAALLYLLLWPVPIDPVAWQAPEDRGLVDPFGPDDRLARAQAIDLAGHEGPEDISLGSDGYFYAAVKDGVILRIDANGEVEEFAEVGGRPLGIETAADGSLIVANAYSGIQRVSPDGSVETLLDTVDGQPVVFADDLAIANDAIVYFSEASTRHSAESRGGSYEASLLDIMEHGGHGRVIAYDSASGQATVLIDGLQFANGVAISEDQNYLLVAETGAYRILRHWLRGPSAGSTEIILDNLPGFPDNINNGMHGRFWVGLVAPRSAQLDALSEWPFLRKVVQRLPAAMRPQALPSSHVIAITGDGQVLMNLQDPAARFPALTGVLETRDSLYLTSLFSKQLGVLRKKDLR